jgi:hypothetical protein
MKPKSKRSAQLSKQIEDLKQVESPSEKRAQRQQKQLLKKARKKHDRYFGQRELKNRIDER